MERGWRLKCPRCGFEGEEGRYYPWCPRCRGPLEVLGRLPAQRPLLGEGSTPLVEAGPALVKLEYLNPTGSFKDRGVSYSLWLAKRLGYRCVVVDSSGNTAVSVAAFAGRLGLEARVYVPKGAGAGKKALIRALGARLVEAPSRDDAASMAERDAGECFHVAHQTSPVFLEGVKSLGRELAGAAGRDVILPVSSGSLLLGVYRGLLESGVKDFRLIAVQSPEAASLEGRVEVLARVGGGSGRLLDALVVKRPARLDEIAAAVESTGGGVVIVGDEAVKGALRELLSAGFIVEPSSAAAWAAFRALEKAGALRGKPLVVLTGSGLKYAGELERLALGAPKA